MCVLVKNTFFQNCVLRKGRRDGHDSIALFARRVSVANGTLINFERAKSRLVAPNFFFRVRERLGVFCHVLSYLVVIFRHFSSFLVILRPKIVFSGMAGNGRLRHLLSREGQLFSPHGSRTGGRMGKMT